MAKVAAYLLMAAIMKVTSRMVRRTIRRDILSCPMVHPITDQSVSQPLMDKVRCVRASVVKIPTFTKAVGAMAGHMASEKRNSAMEASMKGSLWME